VQPEFRIERQDGAVNTLRGALNLVALSVTRPIVSDTYQLLDSARTAADPRITLDVRALARKGLQITTADPIGLYMGGWDDTGRSRPNGSPVGNPQAHWADNPGDRPRFAA
jgi:hypothetical protein